MTTPEQIAKGLDEHQANFLINVCDSIPLGHADRVEDRARQKVRRLGLVRVDKKPRRWVAEPLGLAVREVLKEI